MRKEAIYAIIAGLALGLIIAFGVWRINLSNKKPNISTQATPTPTPLSQTGLTIAKPNNDDVLTAASGIISGLASPESWIVVSTDSSDSLFKTNSDGSFTSEVNLTGGINQFVITAVRLGANTTSQTLRLIYSTQLATPEAAPTAASTESAIREKVLQKVEEVLNSPKAYLGTVTDITDTSIQLKSDSGEILQASVDSKNVVVIKTGPKTTAVKFTDIAIGDYIAALGFRNGNHVLNAKRILITSPQKPPNIKVYFGPVKSVNKKEVALEDLKFTTKLTGLKVGDLIIVVGTVDEAGKFTPRKSFLAVLTSPLPTSKP
ncbi:hypothetical protein COX04_00460 [Candidatus Woesebacteria bacterium CG22_combo_CG10-13_8_21_14_all_45_10]|uniref:DUF5666 domain-containing protein n=1 Tax=Candidatus Woesebacteria bacterium CG22_combo_CG10-13_8_21_14_all_45_10 TaxID=1975060 RepID=A0A2H0BHW6_9BACT|nr:MAG: hypothetical protein COX04_00460 [Candidatus Woesebacteria bacterium CG22_combo_CG10-13_8_21_14_all_45_10]